MATVTREEYEGIPWREVESSNVARVAWSPEDPALDVGVLCVEFHGGRAYSYAGVPKAAMMELREAESVGRHFAEHVRGVFESDRLLIEEAGS